MIELSNVNSFYDRSHILHDVSLAVGKAEILSVLGRNGTGKTTLLKTLMGLTDKSTGRISLAGADIGEAPTFRRARAGMGYVPQGRQIIPDFSVRENILMGSFARKDGRQTIPDVVPALFPYLTDNLNRPGGFCPAASSNSSRLRGRSPPNPRCCFSMSRPKASSPTSSRKSKRSFYDSIASGGSPLFWSSRTFLSRAGPGTCSSCSRRGASQRRESGRISRTTSYTVILPCELRSPRHDFLNGQ